MKTRLVSIAALGLTALLGFVSAASAQGGFGPPELTLDKVRENIYTIRNAGSGNVTMLVGQEGVILIDDKFPQDHDGIMKLVRQVTDAPLKYIINTHLHPDHTGGNQAMQDIGAAIIASENARRIMAERDVGGLPNITMRDTMRVYLDDMPIDLYHFGRAHTDGDIVILLPTEKLLIAGDLFALWGPYESVIDYSAGGSLRDWPHTIDGVLGLDFDTIIPGHSGVTDRANLIGYREYLTKLQGMVQEMLAQKKSREDIQAMLKSEFNWGNLSMRVGLDGLLVEMQ